MRIIISAIFVLLLMTCPVLATTYELATSADDAMAIITGNPPSGVGTNSSTLNWLDFGRYQFLTTSYNQWLYCRFALNIPRGSTISSAVLRFKQYTSEQWEGAFNTTIYGLAMSGSPAWRSTGFTVANYANGAALNAISTLATTATWNNVEAWSVADTWYESPDISTLVQAQIDDADYNPAPTSYIGFKIDDGDGTYETVAANVDARRSYSYDSGAANSIELVVTYTSMIQGISVTED